MKHHQRFSTLSVCGRFGEGAENINKHCFRKISAGAICRVKTLEAAVNVKRLADVEG